MESFRDGLLTRFLHVCENELKGNVYSQFIVGDHISIADIVLSSFIINVIRNEQGPFCEVFAPALTDCPFFKQYCKRMQTVFAM